MIALLALPWTGPAQGQQGAFQGPFPVETLALADNPPSFCLPGGEGLPASSAAVAARRWAVSDDFVRVPGGTYRMGSTAGSIDEKPLHAVRVSDFLIGKYEVTNAQFVEFLNAKGNQTEGGSPWIDLDGSSLGERCRIRQSEDSFVVESGFENHPVVLVSWYGACAYADWLSQREGLRPCHSGTGAQKSCDWGADGYRLPTEAEWEYAAGGGAGSRTKWAGINKRGQMEDFMWFQDNAAAQGQDAPGYGLQPVGKRQPNALGLYDMSGNVWEWCWDWYKADYYAQNERLDPQGPSSGSYRVLRGGSWTGTPDLCQVANRDNYNPASHGISHGFRLVRRGLAAD